MSNLISVCFGLRAEVQEPMQPEVGSPPLPQCLVVFIKWMLRVQWETVYADGGRITALLNLLGDRVVTTVAQIHQWAIPVCVDVELTIVAAHWSLMVGASRGNNLVLGSTPGA